MDDTLSPGTGVLPPRLTVIVCVHNVEGFVEECIDSVLSQDYENFEIVAIDDCSSDSSGEVLDQLAGSTTPLKVVHLHTNIGLGMARNAGLRHGSGEYVMFLDGDDVMAPGSLRAVAASIQQAAHPDVVIYDYARSYWWGALKRNELAPLLASAGRESFPLAAHPELLRIFPVAWNKAYRRAYLDTLDVRFRTGFYEDLSWTFITLVMASRIAVLDRVCIHYRQRRYGGILQTSTRQHFDVFAQYAYTFDYLDARPQLTRWKSSIHRQMVDHLLLIWRHPGRIPESMRAEFFRTSAEHCQRWVPAEGFTYSPDRRQALRQWLLLHGLWRFFQMLRWLAGRTRRLRSRGRRIGRRASALARFLRTMSLRAYYQCHLRLPLNPRLAVYSAYWNRGYLCNPRAIYEKAREIVPHVEGVWIIRDGGDPAPPGVQTVRPNTRAYWKALARAGFLVNNVNFPDGVVKRRGSIHLQTQHGTPIKHMGADLQHYPAARGVTNLGNLLRRSDRWDFNLSANPFSSRIWRRAFPCDYEMLELGYPRNDQLVAATAVETIAARGRIGLSDIAVETQAMTSGESPTVILYAPTHREYNRSFVSPLELNRFAADLGPRYVVLVRSHPLHGVPQHGRPPSPPIAGTGSDRRRDEAGLEPAQIVDMSDYPSVEDLCIAADVLITDYSSVMFDFANLGRPIVLFTPDWDTYRLVRGVYLDIVSSPPGLVTADPSELACLIRTGRYASAEAGERLEQFRQRFCPYDDGHAAERVVRRVFSERSGH